MPVWLVPLTVPLRHPAPAAPGPRPGPGPGDTVSTDQQKPKHMTIILALQCMLGRCTRVFGRHGFHIETKRLSSFQLSGPGRGPPRLQPGRPGARPGLAAAASQSVMSIKSDEIIERSFMIAFQQAAPARRRRAAAAAFQVQWSRSRPAGGAEPEHGTNLPVTRTRNARPGTRPARYPR